MQGSEAPEPSHPYDGLYERSSAGDRDALMELLQAYLPRLRGFVRAQMSPALRQRESDADIVQSVCRDLVERRDELDFENEERFRAWLFTSARRKVLEKGRFHQRKRRDPGQEQRLADESVEEGLLAKAYRSVSTPSVRVIAKEQVERFEAALDALSEDHREVIALARLAGLPHAIVAERMGRSVDATRHLLGRALLRLAEELRARMSG